MRDMIKLLHQWSIDAPPARSTMLSIRLHEQADDARGTLRARGATLRQLGGELFLGQARRQFLRLQISRDQDEGVMMGLDVRRGARPRIVADALGALAADIFVGVLADLAFGEAG